MLPAYGYTDDPVGVLGKAAQPPSSHKHHVNRLMSPPYMDTLVAVGSRALAGQGAANPGEGLKCFLSQLAADEFVVSPPKPWLAYQGDASDTKAKFDCHVDMRGWKRRSHGGWPWPVFLTS